MGVIITYFGEQCFRVESGSTSILVDPTSNRLKADITLRTSAAPDVLPAEQTDIVFPGEYEIGGIEIRGFQVAGESDAKILRTIYEIIWEGIRLVFPGALKEAIPAEIIDQFGETDVLFVPTGGEYLSPEAAVSLVKKIDPKFIIPFGAKAGGEFLKKIGQSAETQEKLVFKKKELEEIEQKVVLLSSYGG